MKSFAYGAFTAIVLAGAGLSAGAFAADKAEARLAAAVSAPRKVIIDGRLWSCEGEKCTAGSQGKNQPITRECARAAKVLGPVVAYRQGERSLDEAGIMACNGGVETARTASGPDAVGRAR